MLRKRITRLYLMVVLAGMAGLGWATAQEATVVVQRPDSKTLSVRYSGAAATIVELRVNGVSFATKPVTDNSTSGEVSFTMEEAKLPDGENQVEIRLYDAAGKVLGSKRMRVQVDRLAGGQVFLAQPKAGTTVQGDVEISVGFKVDMKNVYVSFFVDDQFKSLRNYPPYTFLWDTTAVGNGWHEVEAWVVDEASRTHKTQRMRVYVNNPGGRTNRQPPITAEPEAAVAAPKAQPEALELAENVGTTVVSKKVSPPKAPKDGAMISDLRTMLPTGKRIVGAKPAKPATLAPRQPGAIALESEPSVVEVKPVAEPAVEAKPVAEPVVEPKTAPKAAVEPKTAPKAVVAPKTTPKAGVAPKPARLSIDYGKKLPYSGTYDIYVDGDKVDFDVAPRAEDGVALAPFRHLFEHEGGKVKWDHEAKRVDAKGQGVELTFTIGDANAKLDGKSLRMERKPFIELGRSIVPLSFIKSALGLDVQFDPETRHVVVTKSNKK